MAEFSAHRVTLSSGEKIAITTHVNLYVSPVGDDVLNSGVEITSPFRTPQRAVEWLGDKYISEFGFVTINFAAGVYNLTSKIVMDHDQGNRVAFVGAEPETLILQYVSNYKTYGFTAPGYAQFYSGVTHGITMSCVRPDENTVYSPITSLNQIQYATNGVGVVIEDNDLVYTNDYNPANIYASYPFDPRNNISRQGSILGSHILRSVTGGLLHIESSIRDDWFAIPEGSSSSWARMHGNPQNGVSGYPGGGFCADAADKDEIRTNLDWFLDAYRVGGIALRALYISSVPVGYYGNCAANGNPIGSTANFIGATFPTGNPYGGTASYTFSNIIGGATVGYYSSTGPAGSFLNSSVNFGNNYHEHKVVNGLSGIGSSASWGTVNTNRITVKLIPTVFRRFGNILDVSAGGLRKVKNIFFDGKSMPAHYTLLTVDRASLSGSSNKYAINCTSTSMGVQVKNEPTDLGIGLCTNVGIKDFHVGFHADRKSMANLGTLCVSNCSYGIVANNGSVIDTLGSVCTGMGAAGFLANDQSTVNVARCFASFAGQSLCTLRMESSGPTGSFTDSSFIPGQTFSTPDGLIKGTVWDWDSREKLLILALRVGSLEGADPVFQK